MVIRDDGPAVHFFTMYDVNEDPDSVVNPTKKIHVARDPEFLSWPYFTSFWTGLAAPRDRRKSTSSWTDGNTSTYLTDSGLWTACHESRERMLRHFRPSETSPQASRHGQLDWRTITDIQDRPTASVNMEFTRDNGERQYLTIRPSTDLICLQLLENSMISFGTQGFDWRPIGQFPLFKWRGDDGYNYYSNMKNVAVEYDPAWEDCDSSDRFRSVSSSFFSVYEIRGLETFWFIDYRLKRTYKEERGDGRRTFHAGRLTFIEVSSADSEWCCCPNEGCSAECLLNRLRFSPHGAHDLAYDFERCHLQRIDTELDDDKTWFLGDYGVLACVDLELEGKLPTVSEWFEMNKEGIKRVGF